MFDEERTCSHCHVTTYCDNCPVCGRKLMRTNPSILKIRNRNQVAGEEFKDKTKLEDDIFSDKFKMVKHTAHTDRSENVFDKADHQEPSVSFDQKDTKNRYASNPYFPEPLKGIFDQKLREGGRNYRTLFIILIAGGIIIAILSLYSIFEENQKYSEDSQTSFLDYGSDNAPLKEYREYVNGDGVFLDFEVLDKNLNDDYSDVKITNDNDVFYSGSILFYNDAETKVHGEVQDIDLLPNQSKIVSIYLEGDIETYELEEDGYYTIDYEKPSISYTIETDKYEDNALFIDTTIVNSKTEDLWKYLYIAVGSSYDIGLEAMYGEDVLGNEYSVYFDYDEEPAIDIYIHNTHGDIVDTQRFESKDL